MAKIKDILLEAFKSNIAENPTALSAHHFSNHTQLRSIKIAKAELNALTTGNVQAAIRPIFGKSGTPIRAIGDHPDFLHLKDTDDQEFHYIVTLFMDIEGSTRLSRIHDLPTVKRIKNGFMSLAIELVQCFDGHVHRMQGDSVMAYFGGKSVSPEQASIDALNAASIILLLSERIVAPELRRTGVADPPGIRLGLDFGKWENVMWASYGYHGTSEVTATSYYVDVASKLQHAAPKDGVMIGASLADFLDIPEDVKRLKEVLVDGKKRPELYVMPNYVDGDGVPFDYRQFEFVSEKYLECTALAQVETDLTTNLSSATTFSVRATVHAKQEDPQVAEYWPCSGPVKKQQWLRFTLDLPIARYPYTVMYSVENHGIEAQIQAGDSRDDHDTKYILSTPTEYREHCHWEVAGFRGLHYLIVKVTTANGLNMATKFGVYVE